MAATVLFTDLIKLPQFGSLVNFTGLLMIAPIKGQAIDACCPCGGCVAISVIDGVKVGTIVRAVPGKCVGEYPVLASIVLDSTIDGSFHGVGCRWGEPKDLLANLCADGCCSVAELAIGLESSIQAKDLILLAKPKGTLRTELKKAIRDLNESQALATQLQAQNRTLTAQLNLANAALIKCRNAKDAEELSGLVPKVRRLSDCDRMGSNAGSDGSGNPVVTQFGELPGCDKPCT